MLNFLLNFFKKDEKPKDKLPNPVPPLVKLGPEKVQPKSVAATKKSGRPKKKN